MRQSGADLFRQKITFDEMGQTKLLRLGHAPIPAEALINKRFCTNRKTGCAVKQTSNTSKLKQYRIARVRVSETCEESYQHRNVLFA